MDIALLHLSDILQVEEPLVEGQVGLATQKELSSRVDKVSHQKLKESAT